MGAIGRSLEHNRRYSDNDMSANKKHSQELLGIIDDNCVRWDEGGILHISDKYRPPGGADWSYCMKLRP